MSITEKIEIAIGLVNIAVCVFVVVLIRDTKRN